MLRRGDGPQRGEAPSLVGLKESAGVPVRLVVTGRPLSRARGGALVLGGPVRLESRRGRIERVQPWTHRCAVEGEGSAEAILAPALSDSHAHLVAAASARTALDLAAEPARDLPALLARLRAHSERLPSGSWLRVRGYDEFHLTERRHPTLGELDAAVPAHALRLRHATLHASVLNTRALDRIDPALRSMAVVGDGLLVGQEEVLSRSSADRDSHALVRAIALIGSELASLGIGCVDDITASNDAGRVGLLADAVESGALPQRIRVWLRDADDLSAARVAARGHVEIAGVKLLATNEEDARTSEFRTAISRARDAGMPVAIHAVEPDVVGGALDALAGAPQRRGAVVALDRLEHCSLCPPHLIERLGASRVAVVTQPGFLVARGPKYRREVEAPLWPWLYPIRSLRRAGVLVATGSDAPVISPDPRLGFVGATTRRSSDGVVLGDGETISDAEALDLCTRAAARVRGDADADLPWLRLGARADLVLLRDDPTRGGLGSWRAARTVIGGRVWAGAAS